MDQLRGKEWQRKFVTWSRRIGRICQPQATGLGRVQEVALQQEQQGHLLDCSGRAVDAGDGGNVDSGD